MQKALLIAEKPDLMRKVEACYKAHKKEIPYEITFVSQRGHLVTLKKPDELDEELKDWSWDTLPINPKEHGGWQYKVIEEKKTGNFLTARERYEEIKRELKSGKYDFVINAGDPDQEGELLVRIVLAHMKNRLPVKRFWTNDLTEGHILSALKDLRDDDRDPMLKNLLAAAYGRQHSDYLFGMNLSRAASLKLDLRVAVGRVKTAIQRIVCRREEEIRKFTPETSYGVQAQYKEGFTGTLFNAASAADSEEEEEEKDGIVWFKTEEEAKNLISGLKKAMEVVSFSAKRQSTYAPKMFDLAAAQIEAGKMGYSPADTLRILQSLYEMKYTSYPRTGCKYLGGDENLEGMIHAASAVPSLKKYADTITGRDIARVKGTKTWINPQALQDEGHSALVPTGTAPDWDDLEKEEQDIYAMVCRQFLAPFLPPLVQDKAELIAKDGGSLFKSPGTVLVSPGWTEVFGKKHRDTEIPRHEKGDILDVDDFIIAEKTSTCPKRYTMADLIAVCENPLKYLDDKSLRKVGKRLKIGTPATRANIIEDLIIKDKYLKKIREGKREVVVPTEIGAEIIENIGACDICKVDLTAEWEEQLEKVRSGELSLTELETGMMEHVSSLVEDFRHRDMKPIDTRTQYKKLGTCPLCGKDLMRGPKMFYCSGYRDKDGNGKGGCKAGGYREKYGSIITDEEFMDMVAGKAIIKEMKSGEVTWKQEVICDPATLKITYVSNEKETGYACPVCGKPVIELPNAYRCDGYKTGDCGVYIRKSFGGKKDPIGKEEFEKLFSTGESGVIEGFVSQKGTGYSAKMAVDKKEKKIILKFADKEEKTTLTCPVCGKRIFSRGYRFVCEGEKDGSCAFSMYNRENSTKMADERAFRYLKAVKDGSISGGETAFITDGDVETPWTCPSCKKKLVRNGMKIRCAGDCGFSIGRNMAGHILTDREIGELAGNGKTSMITDFVSKKGNSFSARVVFDEGAENKTKFEFEDVTSPSKYKCPVCGKRMEEDRVKLNCSCGLSIWKKQGGVLLDEEDLEKLFRKGKTGYIRMTSKKTGKPFTARVVLDKDGKRTFYEYK